MQQTNNHRSSSWSSDPQNFMWTAAPGAAPAGPSPREAEPAAEPQAHQPVDEDQAPTEPPADDTFAAPIPATPESPVPAPPAAAEPDVPAESARARATTPANGTEPVSDPRTSQRRVNRAPARSQAATPQTGPPVGPPPQQQPTGPPAAPSWPAVATQAPTPPVGPGLDPSGPGALDPYQPAERGALAHDAIVRKRSERPERGWRAALYAVSGGTINPGPSVAETARARKLTRIRTQLAGYHTVSVCSLKGGVGKTTASALLGLTLAEYRSDRTIAIDANPDVGTLADRIVGDEIKVTIRDMLKNMSTIRTLTDVDDYTALSSGGRLRILASEQDPLMAEQFNKAEYESVSAVLRNFYNIIITDNGTGLMHSAMHGALENTRSLVIVGAPTVDASSHAAKTLDLLTKYGFGQLVRNSVVVLSCDRGSPEVDRGKIYDHFASRVRAVVEIPQDPHLSTGGRIRLDYLSKATHDAALDLAAAVADAFGDHRPSGSGARDGLH